MSQDDSNDGGSSRKELARQQRQQAYQRAKEQRASDPRHIAMKEAAKVQRRALYQQVKERRKAALALQKAKLKEQGLEKKAEERAAKDNELLTMVKVFMSRGSNAVN